MHKTEAVVFTNKYKFATTRLLLEGQTIQSKDKMKYLGMVVERGLLFKDHIAQAAFKAEKIENAIGRLIPNIGGPKESRRKLLMSVTTSILLYGASSWAETMSLVPRNKSLINSVQRKRYLEAFAATAQCLKQPKTSWPEPRLLTCWPKNAVPRSTKRDPACAVRSLPAPPQ